VFYKGNGDLKKVRILSYGINQMGDSRGLIPGIHAEQDAIAKLVPLKRKKRLKVVNILVVRLSSKNNLQSSKPCSNCIEIMKNVPIKKGYKIQNVYYSNNEGNIVKQSLTNLDNEEKHFSRYYKQRKRI
jgi:cytidine deaminase